MRAKQMTEHAQKRKQQRGIAEAQIELIRVFGVDHYQTGGCSLSFIPERTLTELRSAIDRLHNIAIVKGKNDEAVTVIHMNKRILKTSYAA